MFFAGCLKICRDVSSDKPFTLERSPYRKPLIHIRPGGAFDMTLLCVLNQSCHSLEDSSRSPNVAYDHHAYDCILDRLLAHTQLILLARMSITRSDHSSSPICVKI
jgi:hypothetical protein